MVVDLETRNSSEDLRLGIEAARKKRFYSARRCLTRALEQSPRNVPALLWMAYITSSPQESMGWLEQVLAIDPDNERAKVGLAWARKRIAQGHVRDSASDVYKHQVAPSKSAQANQSALELPDAFIHKQIGATDGTHSQAANSSPVRRTRHVLDPLLFLFLFGIISVTALYVIGIWTVAFLPPETLAAWWPAPVEHISAPEAAALVAFEGFLSESTQSESVQAQSVDAEIYSDAEKEVSSEPRQNYTTMADTVSLDLLEPSLPPEIAADESFTSLDQNVVVPPEIAKEALAPDEAVSHQEAENLSIAPDDFIGPAEELLSGPRLFQPVDGALLAHQPASPDEKWIEVDVTEQRVTAWEGNVPIMSFPTSTGLLKTPTVLGKFNIYWKLESTLMFGEDYYLPEVPYAMYFYTDYALHGAYWHDNFGQRMSRGCVNLSIDSAKELFEWADPVIPPGQTQVVSSFTNPGTLVVVHE